jgi:cell division protein FtsI (penicillin-binding protein 3)
VPTTATAKPAVAKSPPAPAIEALSYGDGDAEEIPAGSEVMPNFRGMSMRRVLQVMEKRGINIRLIGSGQAGEQSPPSGHKIRGTDEVWIKFAPSA